MSRARCLALLAALLASGCGGTDAPRNLILISVDTLRADYLGVYGHPWIQTPNIDALAGEGVRFTGLVSPVPTTLASHTSMMTGLYPHRHGVPSNDHKVSESNVMLAEVLRDAGFRTGGFVGGYPLGPQTRFQQGFEDYRLLAGKTWAQKSGQEVTDAALAWLRRDEPRRFFLFVHYWDVHWPYGAPEPWGTMYGDGDLELGEGSKDDVDAARRALRSNAPDAAQRSESLKRLYAGGVSFVDAQVGRLLAGLRERGLLDHSVVVLTADHGESMDAHGAEYFNHGNTLYDAVMHVPLIVRMPEGEGAGRVVDWRLSGIDLMPTLLALLGIPGPEEIQGVSFIDALGEGAAWAGRGPVFAQATKPHTSRYEKGRRWKNDRKCRSVWDGSWKLHHCPLRSRIELYNLSEDPGELVNLSADPALRGTVDRLIAELTRWNRSANPRETIVEDSQEVIEQLRALGYAE